MNLHRVAAIAAACALLAACASAPPPVATTGPGWIAVSANDGKSVLDNGVNKVLSPAPPDTVALIDLHGPAPRLVAEIEAPAIVVGPPMAVAVSPDEGIALVSSGKRAINDALMSDNVLSVIDLKATPPKVVQTAYVGAGAAGVSINRAGTLALVANRDEGTVSVLRVKGKAVEVLGKVALGNEKSGPSHVAITPDGTTALVTRDADHRISVLAIKGEEVSYTRRDLFAGFRPYPVDICGAGDIAVVGNVGNGTGDEDTVSVIDLKADPPRVIDTVTVGQTPEGAVCSPDGRFVAVTAMSGSNKPNTSPFYRAKGRVIVFRVEGKRLVKHGEADVGNWSQGAVFSPDNRLLLVQNMVQKDIQVFAVEDRGLRDTGQRIVLKAGPASIRAAAR
ncbi:MAG TPA: YncE family protein [Albitalea sp.]|uniref:YncE family protein n=1 Tax=Piscinibacter sp. TaxID=1903157 RepID=UPI002ED32509